MAVHRQTYQSPIYEPATYSTKKGKRLVRFKLPKSGEFTTAEVLPNGKAKVQSPYWYCYVAGRRVSTGCTDKKAAESLAAKWLLDKQHGKAGITRHDGTPLFSVRRNYDLDEPGDDHLGHYQNSLESSGYLYLMMGEARN